MLSPRFLAYLSMITTLLVITLTIGMILFPNFFARIDEKFAFTQERQSPREQIALWINHAISVKSVCIFYALISIVLFLSGEWHILGICVTSMIMASLWFWSIKRITQRQRPLAGKLRFKDYSFPSGHTSAGIVFFLSLALALDWLVIGHSWAWIGYGLALAATLVVWWSRWYLKVHWMSDIWVGGLLGLGCFLMAYLFFFYFGDAIFEAVIKVFFSL